MVDLKLHFTSISPFFTCSSLFLYTKIHVSFLKNYTAVWEWEKSPKNIILTQIFCIRFNIQLFWVQENSVFGPKNLYPYVFLWLDHHGFFVDNFERHCMQLIVMHDTNWKLFKNLIKLVSRINTFRKLM